MVESTDGAIIAAVGGTGGVLAAMLSVLVDGDLLLASVLAVGTGLILSGSAMVYLATR